MRTLRLACIFAFLLLALAGCATFVPHPQLPAADQSVRIDVLDKEPGMNDYPIGAYVLPHSQVVVTKPRKISRMEGGLGVLGVLGAHASGKQDSKALVAGQEDTLALVLQEDVKTAVARAASRFDIARGWSVDGKGAKAARMELTPFVHIAPNADGTADLYLFLVTKLYDVDGSKAWSSRFVYLHPQRRVIAGPDGWAANGGVRFKQAIKEGYGEIVRAMVKDAARGKSGWSPRAARVRGPFLTTVDSLELEGEILEETPDKLVFNAAGGGLVYGINILPRDEVQILPPTAK